MKVRAILVLTMLFLVVGVCLAFSVHGDDNSPGKQDPAKLDSVETFKEEAAKAYWEGHNKRSCREVRISLIVNAIKVFMENPNLSPCGVLYIKSMSIALEDSCEMGIRDRQSGENNLAELLESLDLELRIYMTDF
ncbi:MAG: hypothetical protein U9M90_03305 [Patescibacteria group bacterium]|nr:hypothetical protein [Patescibacteria group bacterium]